MRNVFVYAPKPEHPLDPSGLEGWAVLKTIVRVDRGAVYLEHHVVPPPERDPRPHSRACGIAAHEHGTACSSDCPTCQTERLDWWKRNAEGTA